MVTVTSDSIPINQIIDSLRNPDCGAIISYLGTVRSYLEEKQSKGLSFEVSDNEMKTSLESIEKKVLQEFDIKEISIAHRTGSFGVGDEILLIAISAGHRGPAFDACLFTIDKIKELHELWKREELVD